MGNKLGKVIGKARGIVGSVEDVIGFGKVAENYKERKNFKDKFERHKEIDDMYLDGKINKRDRKRILDDLDDLD